MFRIIGEYTKQYCKGLSTGVIMKLMKLLKDGDEVKEIWNGSITIDAKDLHKYEEANLRCSYDDEIIFDAESKVEALLVRSMLTRNRIAFTEWDTGSRGHHFHTRWRGLDNLCKEDREVYRWILINKDKYLEHLSNACKRRNNIKPYLNAVFKLSNIKSYYTDECMRSDTHWVALENRPHLKSGKHKVMVHSYIPEDIYNKLDMELLVLIRNIYIDVTSTTNNTDKNSDFSNSSNDLSDIKRKIKVSDLFKKWGYYNEGKARHNPFWRVSAGKAGVQINDDNNNCFDYGNYKCYTLFDLVMMKHNCSFSEAVQRLKNGNY